MEGQIEKLNYIYLDKHRDKQTEGQSDNQTNILLPIFHFKREAKLIFKTDQVRGATSRFMVGFRLFSN